MCVPRQMVEALDGYELAEIQDQMDDIQTKIYDKKTSPFEKSGREVGVTPRMVLEWCKERKIPCTIMHGAKTCEAFPAEGGKPLVGCWWEGHAYFWKGHAAVKVARRGIPCEAQTDKLAKYSTKNNTPPFEQWKPWRGDIHPGHFYAQDIEDVRRSLLEQGISPRVCMKDRHEVRQLTIGKCCIHTVPENLASIQ